jgi:predicted dehydrogenase
MTSTNTVAGPRPLRAGIVGYGYMGEIRRRTCDTHPELELVSLCDPRLETSPSAGVQLFPGWEAVVDDDLDVVFVCTPNNLTPDVVVRALERGRHVFCEKPPGRCLADIQRIVDAERAHPEAKLIFGFNHRHHPGVVDAKAIVDSGSLGRILTLRGLYGKSGGDGFEKSWRNNPDVGGGGILLDQGIHMLDLFRVFCGDFDEVMGMASTLHWNIPMEDNAFVLLRNPQGQMAQLHSSATQWKHTFRLEIGLEKGYLSISGLLSKTGSYGRETLVIGRRPSRGETVAVGNPREELTYYDNDTSWDFEVDHFVQSIRRNTPVEHGTSLDALRVMEIVDKVYQQAAVARRHRPVASPGGQV